jgi:hypothetical protein
MARDVCEMEAILRVARRLGLGVVAAALGRLAAAPLVVLEDGGWVAGGKRSSQGSIEKLRGAVIRAGRSVEAASREHGTYTMQHALMTRALARPPRADHPARAVLEHLVKGRTVLLRARTTSQEIYGSAAACGGALPAQEGESLASRSLPRQLGFLGLFCGCVRMKISVIHAMKAYDQRYAATLHVSLIGELPRSCTAATTALASPAPPPPTTNIRCWAS